MEEVIKLAIEKGGYEPFKTLHIEYCKRVNYMSDCLVVEPGSGGMASRNNTDILLDPEFWQSLGRGLGWPKYHYTDVGETVDYWLGEALRYFELKLTGGDEAKFWQELINE